MRKYNASLLSFFVAFLWVALPPSLCFAEEGAWSTSVSDSALESSLSFVAVPQLKESKNINKLRFQKSLVGLINSQSFIQALGTKNALSFGSSTQKVVKESTAIGADATLVGEAQGERIDFRIYGASNGRVLSKFSVSLVTLETATPEQLAKATFDRFIASIPYDGFVSSTEGKQINLNIGTLQGLKVGSFITVFDFKGVHPIFSSPEKTVGVIKVLKVGSKTAVAEAINPQTHVTPYMKLKVIRLQDKAAASPIPAPTAVVQVQPTAMPLAPTPAPTARATPRPAPRMTPRPTPAPMVPPPVPTPKQTPKASPQPSATPQRDNIDDAIRATEARARAKPVRQPRKVSNGWWGKIGTEAFAINTSVNGTTAAILERQFQNTLAPGFVVGGGYSRINFEAMFSHLANTSNSVTVFQGDVNYQVFTAPGRTFDFLTMVGVYFSMYAVAQNANATNLLATTNTYSPEFDERIIWRMSPKLRLNLVPSLYYPMASSDAVNGSSQLTSSYGAGMELSLKVFLSTSMALEGGVKGHDFFINMPSAQSLNESEYEIFAQLLFF